MTSAIQRTGPLTTAPGGRPAPGGPAPGGPAPGGTAPGGTVELAGRPVARIGFGVMQLERSGADKNAALAILRQAVGAGVNHLDTAQFYGACNELIRAALAPYDDDLVLATARPASSAVPPGARMPAAVIMLSPGS